MGREMVFAGWTEFDVKEKSWQIFTLGGETYIKVDFTGKFMNVGTKKLTTIDKIFHLIRNCTDSEGYIIAKRKKMNQPLYPLKNKSKRQRIPTCSSF